MCNPTGCLLCELPIDFVHGNYCPCILVKLKLHYSIGNESVTNLLNQARAMCMKDHHHFLDTFFKEFCEAYKLVPECSLKFSRNTIVSRYCLLKYT